MRQLHDFLKKVFASMKVSWPHHFILGLIAYVVMLKIGLSQPQAALLLFAGSVYKEEKDRQWFGNGIGVRDYFTTVGWKDVAAYMAGILPIVLLLL